MYTLSLHDALPISRPAKGERASAKPNEVPSAAPTISPRSDSSIVTVDRKSTRLNSSHVSISYAVFCLKKKNVLVTAHLLRHSVAQRLAHGHAHHLRSRRHVRCRRRWRRRRRRRLRRGVLWFDLRSPPL